MRQCCLLPVFNNAWRETLGSNQCLWNQAAYEKKLVVDMQKAVCSSYLFSLMQCLSLHPSAPALPAQSEFYDMPRLNFLSALGGCQSRPGSPAHKPPQQQGQWLSHKPSALLLPCCQADDFCRQLASESTGCCTLHSNLSSPTENGFIPAARAGFLFLWFVRWQKHTQYVLAKTSGYIWWTGLQSNAEINADYWKLIVSP